MRSGCFFQFVQNPGVPAKAPLVTVQVAILVLLSMLLAVAANACP